MNKKPIFLTSHDIAVLEGFSSISSAYKRILYINTKLECINKRQLKYPGVSIDNYTYLYEIPKDQVYKALEAKVQLILKSKDVNFLENKCKNNYQNFQKTLKLIGRMIMNAVTLYDYAAYYDIDPQNIIESLKSRNIIIKK
ncbi:MAG: hypothetical protein PSX81_02645 [bacterium]|nr:hypothetical protein [bacterium]